MYRRIVVGLDASAPASAAADFAASIAALQQGRVTLVSVVESAPRFVSARGEAARGDRDARARLDEAQRSTILRLRRRGIAVDGLTRVGHPVEEILRVARALSADLVAIGRSSDGTPGVPGSDAARIVRTAPCSVLLAPPGAASAPARMLVGYDGSPASAHALELGAALATAFAARLVVATSDVAAEQPWSRPTPVERRAGAGTRRASTVLHGDPVQALVAEVRRNDTQLLVLGSTGVGHPWSADLGATATRVIRDAPVAVLVVRLPTIAETVGQVMRRDVHSVTPDTTVRETTAMLLEQGIKSLPVVADDGRLLGIVTLGDLLRRAGVTLRPSMVAGIPEGGMAEYLEGLASRDRTVREIMTADPVTVGPDVPAAEALALLAHRHVKRLPIVEDGRLVGIVSRADLLRALAGVSGRDDVSLRRAMTGRVAADVMQPGSATVQSGAPLGEAARAVLTSEVGRVAVVDDQDRLVGVISTRDLLPLTAGHSLRQLLDAMGPGIGPRDAFLASLGRRADRLLAADLMRHDVVTVAPGTALDEILRLMMSRGLKRLLVVDRGRHILGVVDRADIMRAIGPAVSGIVAS
jgi:CBS domain-containing protein